MGVVSLPIGSRAEFKYVHMTSKGDFLDWVEGPEGAGEVRHSLSACMTGSRGLRAQVRSG